MTEAAQLPPPSNGSRALQEAPQTRLPQQYVPGAVAAEQVVDDDAIDLREYWHILLRYKWTIALVVALALGLALIATFNTTPIYKASTLIQIDRTSNRIVEYGDVTAEGRAGMRDPEFYTTQYELLKSRSLARRVIDQVGLRAIGDAKTAQEPSFLDGIKQSIKGMIATFSAQDPEADALPPADREEARRKSEENLLLANLTIAPVRNSRLVRVGYESPYPGEASAIANAIATNFINLNLERRYDASAYAKQFLQEQLTQTRATLEESEKRFVAYARERQIVNFEDRLEILRNQLREMNSNLVQAEAARFAAESEYQELLEAGPGGAPGLQESSLIQGLKERRSDLQAEYQQQLQVFKPSYPAMQKLQRQIAEIDAELARESTAIRESVRATFQARIREEAKLRQRIQEAKEEALQLQDRTTDYETLKREVETNRELYDGLLQRMKEVGVAAGVGENNISVVDAATVPLRPYKPSLRKNLSIALVLGLFLGAGLAFLLNSLDDTIKSADDVERHVGAPVLSLIPHASAQDSGLTEAEFPLIAFKDPKSAIAEAVALAAHLAAVLDRRGCPARHALRQRWAGSGKDDNGGEHRDRLCPGRRQGAPDRRRPAQPLAASCLWIAERDRTHQSSRRQCDPGRDRSADPGAAAIHHDQRPAAAESGRAAVDRQDGRSAEPFGGALRSRHHRRPATDRSRRRPATREPGQGHDLHGRARGHAHPRPRRGDSPAASDKRTDHGRGPDQGRAPGPRLWLWLWVRIRL